MARPNKNQFARSGYCLALAMCIIAAMGCYFGPFYQAGFRPFMQYEKTRGVILAEDSTHCGRGPKFEPLVRYQYTVNGITYQGHQYVLGSQCGDPRMKPEYFKDKGVTVHYSAKRPSFSVLVLTWGNRTSALSLVGLCFLAAALYGWKLDLKLEKMSPAIRSRQRGQQQSLRAATRHEEQDAASPFTRGRRPRSRIRFL